jgi:hypothetical protein
VCNPHTVMTMSNLFAEPCTTLNRSSAEPE